MYSRINWLNSPSIVTPINDTNLNKMDLAIDELSKGWQSIDATLTYASADAPTFTVSTSAGVSGYVGLGNKIKLTQAEPLTALWNFNSNSASQVGSFNGTDTNVTYTAGKFGNAATFNESAYIALTDTALLKPTGNFTFGCWIKTTDINAGGIFQSYASPSNISGWSLRVNSGKITFICGNNTGTVLGTNYSALTGSKTVNDNVWHYIVVTYKSNTAQIYVDGILDIEAFCFTPAYNATNYVYFGTVVRNGTPADSFLGQIDDAFLINGQAMDFTDVKRQYDLVTAQTVTMQMEKKFIVTLNPISNSLTLYGGTDYILSNLTISNPYFSVAKNPYGFNSNPEKWSISATFSGTSSGITARTGKTIGSIVLHIGMFNIFINGYATWSSTANADFDGSYGLSLTQDSNPTISRLSYISKLNGVGNLRNNAAITIPNYKVASKTTFYSNIYMFDPNAAYNGTIATTCVAICAYL